jgi:hypothetical protein
MGKGWEKTALFILLRDPTFAAGQDILVAVDKSGIV